MTAYKGLVASILRSGYDSNLNAMHGKTSVTVIGTVTLGRERGPFVPLEPGSQVLEPTEDRPAVVMVTRTFGGNALMARQTVSYLEPVNPDGSRDGRQYMFGGTYAATSDSRFTPLGGNGALKLHDRCEQ